ncbi:MAG: uroporphyrinogen-III C-methyltransferase [Oxalobacter formigenes]|nr:uroporphyrinogen-III C-methyltransferase [Oxalobacter formigenes]
MAFPDEPALGAQPLPAPGVSPDPIRQQRRWLVLFAVALCVVVAGLLGHLWMEHLEASRLREELASRFRMGDTANTEVRGIAYSMQETVRDIQGRVAALESRQAESQSRYASLEEMYQELARGRDDRALAEFEQILLMADRQLQFSGNVHGALAALESADKLLSRDNRQQFLGLRRALARDMERLKAAPHVDISGMAVKLDAAISQVGALPLLSDAQARLLPQKDQPDGEKAARQPLSVSADGGKAEGDAGKKTWFSPLAKDWKRLSGEFWQEVRSLVQIRHVSAPGALALSPEQAYFLRENLALRLLGARVALLARDHASFSGDMKTARRLIDTYFDQACPQVKAIKETLAQITDNNVAVELPGLSDSLIAVQHYRAQP